MLCQAARYRFVFPQLGMSDTAWWKVHGIGQSVGALVVLAALATAIATKFTMHGGVSQLSHVTPNNNTKALRSVSKALRSVDGGWR